MGASRSKNEAQKIIGKEMRRLAFERDIEGPYYIADYIIEWARKNGRADSAPHRSTIADYLRGKAFPNRDFVGLFVEAMDLNEEEETRLARVFTFPAPVAA